MAKVVFPIKLEQETIDRIKKIALEGNASQWVRILIEKELAKMDMVAMEKKYGSVEFEGKKYILCDQADFTNRDLGHQHDTHFEMSAHAIEVESGNEYIVYWKFENKGEDFELDSYDYDDVYKVKLFEE